MSLRMVTKWNPLLTCLNYIETIIVRIKRMQTMMNQAFFEGDIEFDQ